MLPRRACECGGPGDVEPDQWSTALRPVSGVPYHSASCLSHGLTLLPGALTCLTCGTTSILKGRDAKKKNNSLKALFFEDTKLHIFLTESLI